MKTLKYMALGLLAGAAVGITGCTNLDETLYDQLNETNLDFTNPTDISLLKGQAIAQFRYFHESWFGYFHQAEMSTDIYCVPQRIGIGWGDLYILHHRHTLNYNDGMSENNWGYAYKCIGYCNRVLDAMKNIEGSQEIDEAERSQVRFFRATIYWYLLDMFRNVPLETTMEIEDGYLPEQNTAQEIYDFCVSELTEIKNTIGTEHVHGYPNKYACCMVLAKLYLNRGVYLGLSDNTEGYEAALAEVNTVIDEGGYSLATNYLDNFREDISDSPEVIFCNPGDRTHAITFNLHTYLMPQDGLTAYGCTATATNGSNAIPQFVDTYDVDDSRFDDTWAHGIQYAAVKDANGDYVPQSGDPIPFIEDDWSGTGYLNYNRNVHSIDGAYQQEGYRLHKYEIVSGNFGTSADDLCIFRLADAYFIKAECLLRLGRDKQVAADLVTQVRQRAFSSNSSKATRTVADLEGGSVYNYGLEYYSTFVDYTDWTSPVRTHEGGADIELGGLFDDLGWEFACEEHRRQDMIRFKMADGRSVFTGKSYFCKEASTDNHWEIFPIPEAQMKANIKLKQNPGYTGAE
ncbi:MAG: RagB/SusD family nutrient uptake outer membrane protein [Bacteroidales bacterium]|nr:RagB/SusD family nutrient uptake outer membrane protein [Bacteroidales bacterium]